MKCSNTTSMQILIPHAWLCAEGGNNTRIGPDESKCHRSHKTISHHSADMKQANSTLCLRVYFLTRWSCCSSCNKEYLLGWPRVQEGGYHATDSPPQSLQHVFIQKAQCWERYDLSINRQGANSSKGKQLFKIKDKAGYCTNAMSWLYEKAETEKIHSQKSKGIGSCKSIRGKTTKLIQVHRELQLVY